MAVPGNTTRSGCVMRTSSAELETAAGARFAAGRFADAARGFAEVFVERFVVAEGIGHRSGVRAVARFGWILEAHAQSCLYAEPTRRQRVGEAMVAERARYTKKPKTTPWWAWLAGTLALLAAVGIGLYVARKAPPPTSALPGQSSALPPASTTTPASTIQHPIGEAASATDASAPVLPALDASDAAAIEALTSLAGTSGLGALLNPEHVIQRAVAT